MLDRFLVLLQAFFGVGKIGKAFTYFNGFSFALSVLLDDQ